VTDANEWFLGNHDHLQDLGIAIEAQREGYVRLSLPHEDSLTNPGSGVIQGGVVATLIDHAAGAAIRTTLEAPRTQTHATTELNVSYLRPATADLTAEATVVRSGRTRGVVSIEVTAETPDGPKEIAVGRVALFLEPEDTEANAETGTETEAEGEAESEAEKETETRTGTGTGTERE
jgi:uncharacterized protein (TIGR00369 family)